MTNIKIFNPESTKPETYSIINLEGKKFLMRYNKLLSCSNHNFAFNVILRDNKIICDKCNMEVYTIATKERIKKFKELDKWYK